MNEALSSILCSEKHWQFEDHNRRISFNADGTGEVVNLWHGIEMNYFITLEFAWRIMPSSSPPPPADLPPRPASRFSWTPTPELLGQLNLEITLRRKLPRTFPDSMRQYTQRQTQDMLRDEAFVPKSFCVRVERGNFLLPSVVGIDSSWNSRYALRLLFDRPPVPPREEWRNPQPGPEGYSFWETSQFVARALPEQEGKRRAMNDVASAGCIVL
ncbi:MAG: hypothetical protein M1829_006154 [Trizodia sp. TS-e1964]|nr:MAG: hypothetical protein M1829_006154 [Trizodia sp. TS-e1964]